MPIYPHAATMAGFAAVNAALGKEFAQNGGITGMFSKDPNKEAQLRAIDAEIALQKMKGEQDIANINARGGQELTLEDKRGGSAANLAKLGAVHAHLAKMGMSPEFINEFETKRKDIEATNLDTLGTEGKVRKAAGQIEGSQYGVSATPPGVNSDLQKISEAATRSVAATPTIKADQASLLPANTVKFDSTQPGNPASRQGMTQEQTSEQQTDPLTGLSTFKSLNKTVPSIPILTPQDYAARLAAKSAPAEESASISDVQATPDAAPNLMQMLQQAPQGMGMGSLDSLSPIPSNPMPTLPTRGSPITPPPAAAPRIGAMPPTSIPNGRYNLQNTTQTSPILQQIIAQLLAKAKNAKIPQIPDFMSKMQIPDPFQKMQIPDPFAK